MPRSRPNARSTKRDDHVKAPPSRHRLARRTRVKRMRTAQPSRWICCCDCCCLINQSCLGVLRPSSRAAVSPGPHPITMCYHSDHALATQPPSFGSSVGYRERLLRVLMLLPELSHAVTARHQPDTFDPSNRSREGVSLIERKPGPSHVYGRRPPKLEVGAARTQRFAPAAVAVFYSGGRPCGSVRFHS